NRRSVDPRETEAAELGDEGVAADQPEGTDGRRIERRRQGSAHRDEAQEPVLVVVRAVESARQRDLEGGILEEGCGRQQPPLDGERVEERLQGGAGLAARAAAAPAPRGGATRRPLLPTYARTSPVSLAMASTAPSRTPRSRTAMRFRSSAAVAARCSPASSVVGTAGDVPSSRCATWGASEGGDGIAGTTASARRTAASMASAVGASGNLGRSAAVGRTTAAVRAPA